MGTPNEWRGDAPAVADYWELTVTGPATGAGSVVVPVGAKSVSIAYANTETADVIASRLQSALASAGIPEFAELSWLYPGGGVISGTATRAGVPVTVGTIVVTAATGVAVAKADVIPATGPNFADLPANWSLGHLPGVGEDAVFKGGSAVLYGLSGMYAGAVDATRFFASFTAGFGLPRTNANGTTPYVEYRTRALDVSADGGEIHVGEGAGSGVSRGFLKIGDNQIVRVHKTGQAVDEGVAAVEIGTTGSGNPSAVNVYGGSVAVGNTLSATQSIDLVSSVGSAEIDLYSAATTVDLNNGSVRARGVTGTLNVRNGEYTQDAGSLGTVEADGGIVRLNNDQGATPTVVHFRASLTGNPPYLDLTGTDIARMLGAGSYFRGGAFVLDPFGTCVITAVRFDRASLHASDIGDEFDVTRT